MLCNCSYMLDHVVEKSFDLIHYRSSLRSTAVLRCCSMNEALQELQFVYTLFVVVTYVDRR